MVVCLQECTIQTKFECVKKPSRRFEPAPLGLASQTLEYQIRLKVGWKWKLVPLAFLQMTYSIGYTADILSWEVHAKVRTIPTTQVAATSAAHHDHHHLIDYPRPVHQLTLIHHPWQLVLPCPSGALMDNLAYRYLQLWSSLKPQIWQQADTPGCSFALFDPPNLVGVPLPDWFCQMVRWEIESGCPGREKFGRLEARTPLVGCGNTFRGACSRFSRKDMMSAWARQRSCYNGLSSISIL